MNKLALPILLILFALETNAQTDPMWTMYHQNLLYHNATLTGNDSANAKTVQVQYRRQWPQTTGNGLRTFQATYSQRWKDSHANIGAYAFNSNTNGAVDNVRLGLLYSYRLNLTKKLNIRFGINAYFMGQYFNVTKYSWASPAPPMKSNLASYGIFPATSIYFGNAYLGVAENFTLIKSPVSALTKWIHTFHMNAGHIIPIDESFTFKPSLSYMRIYPAEVLQINTTISFKGIAEAGVSFRDPFGSNLNPICVNAALSFFRKKLTIAFAYDFQNNSMLTPGSQLTSQEVAARFRFR